MNINCEPIFIHSLFRSGSTYLSNVFRRSSTGYWCFQEPLHELAFFCRENPAGLQEDHGETKAQLLRHPKVDGSYFKELLECWPIWKDAIKKPIIYDAYFGGKNEDIGIAYWRSLAEAAHGRSVFQECRTAGRIGAIKSQMGGSHIYLWRNPWDQWWSYKVTPYFEVANQLIIHARNVPKPMQSLLAAFDLPVYEENDLAGEFAFYGEIPFTSEQSYQVFYLLWCLGMHEGLEHADLMLDIDRLSDSAEYQSKTQARLKEVGIDGIDFSDCRVPQGRYLEKEQAFFVPLEERVHQWLIRGGWHQLDLDQILTLRQQCQPASWSVPIANLAPSDLAEQTSRVRELVLRYETTLAYRASKNAAKLSEAETKAQRAEAKAQQAEAKAQQAEAKAQQAEAKAQQAEAKAQRADNKAQRADTMAQQAEAKAQRADSKAQQAEAKAQRADTMAQQAEAKAQQAEAKAQRAEAKAQRAEAKAQRAEAASNQALTQLDAVYASWSWRITAPLRWLASPFMRWDSMRTVPVVPTFADRMIRWAMMQPRLVFWVHRSVDWIPPLRDAITFHVGRSMHHPFPQNYQVVDRKALHSGQRRNLCRSFPTLAQDSPHSVDEILNRIRAELRQERGK